MDRSESASGRSAEMLQEQQQGFSAEEGFPGTRVKRAVGTHRADGRESGGPLARGGLGLTMSAERPRSPTRGACAPALSGKLQVRDRREPIFHSCESISLGSGGVWAWPFVNLSLKF